jgi:hypothetical protein
MKDEGLRGSGSFCRFYVGQCFLGSPRCLRGVSWSLSRTLRLKSIYAMDETSDHPRVSDTDFEVRRKTTVEVVECSCFSWWWLSWSNEVDRPPVTWLLLSHKTNTKIYSIAWLDGDWLDTTWAKVLRLCYQMTTEVDLFETAATIICTFESNWSTVGR